MWVRFSPLQLKYKIMMKLLDNMAFVLYREFGFNTCTEEQQEIILQQFVKNIKLWKKNITLAIE